MSSTILAHSGPAAYSPEFQESTLALMYQEKDFLALAASSITPGMFETKPHSVLAGIFTEFAAKHPGDNLSKLVVLEELKDLVHAKKIDDTDLPDIAKALSKCMAPVPSAGWIKSQIRKFVSYKVFESELVNSAGLLKKGSFDQIVTRINRANALIKGEDKAPDVMFLSSDYRKERLERYATGAHMSGGQSTSVAALDNVMFKKGCGPGELVVFCGSPGRGKSILLLNCAWMGVMNGENVLYYTLEVDQTIVDCRSDASMINIPVNDLHLDTSLIDSRWKQIEKLPLGNLIMRDLPARYLTASKIRADLYRLLTAGIKIHKVVVDYADIQADDEKSSDKRIEQGNIYVDDRAIAKEFGVAFFTASQANKISLQRKDVSIEHMAEDFSKAFTADYVIGLSQTRDEETLRLPSGHGTGVIRLFLAKNRNGPKSISVPVMTDFTRSRFSIDDWGQHDRRFGFPTYPASGSFSKAA